MQHMRDRNTIGGSGNLPHDAEGKPIRKCSKARCPRPVFTEHAQCARCRSYAREYSARNKQGAAVAAAYCAQLWAPKGGAK